MNLIFLGMAFSSEQNKGITYWTCGIHKEWNESIKEILSKYEHITSFHKINENEGCKKTQ